MGEYYCWGQEVYAPCIGMVVQAKDGYKERSRTNIVSDTLNAYKNAHCFNPQYGSIRVSVGQNVKKGELIGRVGHSGNSYVPHLHFQLMDSEDIKSANGIPSDKDKIRFQQ